MTAPTPLSSTAKLGPGKLILGATGAELDASCLVNSCTIQASKDKDDDVTKLCGTVRAGAIKYTYELTGNFDADVENADGLFALSQADAGTEVPFEFVPSTAAGTSAKGRLVIDPLDFGSDEFGSPLQSDFTFSIVDKPVYTWTPVVP